MSRSLGLIHFSIMNIIKRTIFTPSNYFLLFITYLFQGIVLYQSANTYLLSKDGDFSSLIVAPFYNSFNVIISFIFVFGYSEYLVAPLNKKTSRHLKRINDNEWVDQVSYFFGACFYSLLILTPALIQIIFLSFSVGNVTGEMIYPLLGCFILHVFIYAWMNIYARMTKNRNATALMTFFTIGVFTFLFNYSSLINNILLSQILNYLSFVPHLKMVYSGVFRLSDFVYFSSWILCCIFMWCVYPSRREKEILSKKKIYLYIGRVGVFLCVLMINFIGSKHDFIVDLSVDKKMSLTKETKQELKKIKSKISAYIFSNTSHLERVNNLISLYKILNKNITFSIVDPDLRPDLVNKYEVRKIPSIVLESEKKHQLIYPVNEENITLGMIRASALDRIIVGIYSQKEEDYESLKQLRRQLKNSFYEQKMIYQLDNLIGVDVLIYKANYDIDDDSHEKIEKFINQGGHLIALIPPNLNNRLVKWRKYLITYGIDINQHFAVDLQSHVSGSKGTVPFVNNPRLIHGSSLSGKIILPLSSAITLTDQSSRDVSSNIIVGSHDENGTSWGEKNINEVNTNLVFNKDDIQGPIGFVSHSILGSGKKGRLTTISSSDFLDDKYQNISSNVDYVMNLLNARDEINISQTVRSNMSGLYKNKVKNTLRRTTYYVFALPVMLIVLFFYIKRKYD